MPVDKQYKADGASPGGQYPKLPSEVSEGMLSKPKDKSKKINPHAFRHSMATDLLAYGMDIIGVSRRLGHAKPSTTVNTYAHLVDESDKNNSDTLARLYSSGIKIE